MHPLLFKVPEVIPLLGGYEFRVYGLMVALGFLAALFYVKHETKRLGLESKKFFDVFFYMAIYGMLGARLFYMINSVGSDFWTEPFRFFRVWEGGLVFQGGVIGALVIFIFYTRRHRMPFFATADLFAPALALGHVLGRIGCFFAGCCYGAQCSSDFLFAVVFPHDRLSVAPPGIPLYPVQLFESFGELLIFGFLFYYRKRKPFDGAVFLAYVIIYSVLRGVLEIYRGDQIRGFVIEPYLSSGQFISLIAIIVSLFLWVYLKRKAYGQRNHS